MKIAISAQTKNGFESQVAGHFGHAPYFAIIDLVENQVKGVTLVENPYLNGHQPGQIPQFIHSQGVEVMLSGGMGGRAIQFFEQLGIAAATGASGTVQNAVEAYLKGDLHGAAPCADSVAHGHGDVRGHSDVHGHDGEHDHHHN
ncbi:MAG TPA: NifB/NifX family molybdenum-iron cluster-binding protein [Anaerolineales bacterium]|nr:NifB/NifX family molybdenum-iron cluster-binding protein [Anaerolineales bacterium]